MRILDPARSFLEGGVLTNSMGLVLHLWQIHVPKHEGQSHLVSLDASSQVGPPINICMDQSVILIVRVCINVKE